MTALHTSAPAGSEPTGDRHVWFPAAWLGSALLLATLFLWWQKWSSGALFLVGMGLGWTLFRSSFGFASAYRNLLQRREVSAVLAQLLLIGIITVLFAPLLAQGEVFDQAVRGAVAPVGLSGAFGALLFGVGMQLGGACGCGTLFTLGGGRLLSLVALVPFGLGAFLASWTRPWFANWYSLGPIALTDKMAWPVAVALQLVVLAALAWFLKTRVAKASPLRQDSPAPQKPALQTRWRWLRGPWSWTTGAIVLALLSVLVLVISGQPWRITWGFMLAATKMLAYAGFDTGTVPFWASPGATKALEQPIWLDTSSVTNFGLIGGAALAAFVSNEWKIQRATPARAILAHIVGGLLMGYGAFLAAGCNVNAFVGGIGSTSLHGWVWIAAALLGTAIGIKLRPKFQL